MLSTMWKHLWAFVPDLSITEDKCNVQDPGLDLRSSGSPYLLDFPIFRSEALKKFRTGSSCILIFPSSDYLPNLKVLSLCEVMFVDEDSVQRLFCGPSLESSSIKRCKWRKLTSVHISAPKFQQLSIDDYADEEHYGEKFFISRCFCI
ncbi:hypothetical protein CDL15_Pgr000205 [Punica granatum]|uniref:Uncharacterized protein n=1 Tax=Punica granatum TaxID=22663 RepID=A0A218Y353_PUNGR|nr:hypothetical protein CDL15_Pgr000205 [Punica granatum]